MRMIKVKELTDESFAKYGKVLTIEGRKADGDPATHEWYPQVAVVKGDTSINLMKVIPHEFVVQDFEEHRLTDENLLAFDGELIVAVAPAGELNADQVEAFLIPAGKGISCLPHVWHAVPFAVGRAVMSACVFKNNTSHDDKYCASIDEPIGLSLA
ncbi:MAG: hypothetical protein E7300_01350 [Lachnospiraceae bacterium]|nr:hypothetical protein [Lachnospiraceae bacterium]